MTKTLELFLKMRETGLTCTLADLDVLIEKEIAERVAATITPTLTEVYTVVAPGGWIVGIFKDLTKATDYAYGYNEAACLGLTRQATVAMWTLQ